MDRVSYVAGEYRIDALNMAGRPVGCAVWDQFGWAVMARERGVRVGRVIMATRTVRRVDQPMPGLSLRESAHQVLAEVVAAMD